MDFPTIPMKMTYQCFMAVIVTSLPSGLQIGYRKEIDNYFGEVVSQWIKNTISLNYEDPDDIGIMNKIKEIERIKDYLIYAYLLGEICGILLSLLCMRVLGLRKGIIANNVFVFLSTIIVVTSKIMLSSFLLMASRLLDGIYCGISMSLVPIFLAEISPNQWRGTLVCTYPLFWEGTTLLTHLMYGEKKSDDGMLVYPILSVLIACSQATLFLFPESPIRLLKQKKLKETEDAFNKLWDTKFENPESESTEDSTEQRNLSQKISAFFSKKEYRISLLILFVTIVSVQLTEKNLVILVFNLLTELPTHYTNEDEERTYIRVWQLVSILFTICVIDIWGRRYILMASLKTLVTSIVLFWLAFFVAKTTNCVASEKLCVFATWLFAIYFASGLKTVPWIWLTEPFPVDSRLPIVITVMIINWITKLLTTFILVLAIATQNQTIMIFIFTTFQFLIFFFFVFTLPKAKNLFTTIKPKLS